MPRRRSQTQLIAQQEQPNPDYTEFRNQVNLWYQDLFLDTDPKTGYLIKEPKGFYGSRIKQLVHYVFQQSNEVKAIQTNQQIRTSSLSIYIFHVFKYLIEYILPALFALAAAYLYYSSADSVPSKSSQDSLVSLDNVTETGLYSAAQTAGTYIGDFARSLLSVPVGFATSTVDRVLHVQEGLDFFQTYGYKFIYTLLIGFSVYCISLLLFRLLLNIQHLISKQWTLWKVQGLFLKETQETIERAITSTIRPFLLKSYEQLLCQTSEGMSNQQKTRAFVKSMYLTYTNDLSMLRSMFFERAEAHIKTIPFSELLVQGQVSKQYLNGLYRLIRDSDQQLSMLLFDLNQEIAQVSPIRRQLTGI
jgi:hypothetical protein